MRGDPYSRLVAFLKVVLPLIALGLLSTLFLLSKRIEPGSSIPFAEGEITERIREQQVTGPFFSGVTTNGDKIAFTAQDLSTDTSTGNTARDVFAQLEFATGGTVILVADRAEINIDADMATLDGNILIESSTGYRMRSDTVTTQLSALMVVSPGEVRATGPAGDLTAGAMRISEQENASSVQLLFSSGVKLIYDPKDHN